tara:strand:+ start:2109 stop:2774 length:666 start_codon:yes stop_codon:yes gene_type:complete
MNKLNHIAFIMDGNGRWGKKKGRGRNYGHLKGVETVKKIVIASIKLKIPIVTFYVFSSENWKRPRGEIKYLFKLIEKYFLNEIKSVITQGIKINIIGDLKKLPNDLKKVLQKSIKYTNENKKIIVNLAINYGSKNEIINAFKKTNKINIKNFEKNLYTKDMPNPEILIRTGGHQRLSNFMLWQLAYSELFFLRKLWPDFNSNDLKNIIIKFKRSKRNFGAI